MKTLSKSERREAAFDILFTNQLFSSLIEKFKEKPLPLDSIATDYLQREFSLGAPDAEACWSVSKQNLLDYGLYEEVGNKQVILSRENAPDIASADEGKITEHNIEGQVIQTNPEDANPYSTEPPPISSSHKNRRITPQITFNVQVVIPENASAETYNVIFESMATHLLRQVDEEE